MESPRAATTSISPGLSLWTKSTYKYKFCNFKVRAGKNKKIN